MAQLKQMVIAYVPPKTLNISDLDKVSLCDEIIEKTFTKDDGTEFTIQVIEKVDENGNVTDYRVPKSVIAQLNTILMNKDDFDEFKVIVSGSGMSTRYQVIPL